MILKKLQRIGLSEKEVNVYVTSLRYGPQPVSNIARRTRISRATVYDVFSTLIKKGLAHKIEKGSTAYFEVLAPENLISYLEREKQEFIRKKEREKVVIEEILSELKSIEPEKTTKPKVRFFEGDKGLREAYEATLESKESIRAYANVEDMHKGLPSFFPEYYGRRRDAGISIQAISPDNELSKERKKNDANELREIKLIDKNEFEFSPEVNIYDNKVLYASWREKMAVLIESEEIADFHKKMFDLLWSKLK